MYRDFGNDVTSVSFQYSMYGSGALALLQGSADGGSTQRYRQRSKSGTKDGVVSRRGRDDRWRFSAVAQVRVHLGIELHRRFCSGQSRSDDLVDSPADGFACSGLLPTMTPVPTPLPTPAPMPSPTASPVSTASPVPTACPPPRPQLHG